MPAVSLMLMRRISSRFAVASLLSLFVVACGQAAGVGAATGTGSGGGATATGSGGGAPHVTVTLTNVPISPNGMWASGPTDVYAVGQAGEPFAPAAVKSMDDGGSFATIVYGGPFESGPGASTYRMFGAWGRGPGDFVAVGDGGAVGHTTDGGASWSMSFSGNGTDHHAAVWGYGQSSVFVVGTSTGMTGVILASSDAAKTFARTTTSAADALAGVWAASDHEAYAVGAKGTGGAVLHTVDGVSWAPSGAGTGVSSAPLAAVWGSGTGDVYVAGAAGTFHSTNAGATWAKVDPRASGAVWGRGSHDVYVTATSPAAKCPDTVLHSADGGASWVALHQEMVCFGALAGTSDALFAAVPGYQSGTIVVLR